MHRCAKNQGIEFNINLCTGVQKRSIKVVFNKIKRQEGMSQALNNFIERVQNNPLHSLEEWEEDLLNRYPDPDSIVKEGRTAEEYRNYEKPTRDTVKEFYRLNHINQTYEFVLQKEENFLKLDKKEMSVWDAFDFLNQLVDDSDPDTDLDQLQHLLAPVANIRSHSR